MTSLRERQLFESFGDREYRSIYVDELVGQGLAYQIRTLREKNGWTQEELAGKTDKAQETISQWENPDYGSYTLKTLKTLASAFDVALRVQFVSFRELIRQTSNLTPEIIAPPNYSEERLTHFLDWRGGHVVSPVVSDEAREVGLSWRSWLAALDTGAIEEREYESLPVRTVIAGIDEECAYAAD